MSLSISERGLRYAAIGSLLALAAATACFYLAQNRLGIIGGQIAFSKAAWLGIAVLFWLILPALICLDTRVAPAIRRPYALLLLLMSLRAVLEPPMLYWLKNWSPLYGIAHDVLCMGVLLWSALVLIARNGREPDPRARLLVCHMWVSGLLFLAEIYFAWFMWMHFDTKGGAAIYYVPDDPKFAVVLLATGVVDVCAVLYLIVFLPRWLKSHA